MATRSKTSGGRKKSTSSRKKSTSGRKKSSSGGRKKSSSSRKKSTSGRKSSGGKKSGGRKYSRGASGDVGQEMHEYKRGKARSGGKGGKVKSRKQAIAIGLSKARRSGKRVPPNPNRGGRKKKSS